jgi:hypothetical protein
VKIVRKRVALEYFKSLIVLISNCEGELSRSQTLKLEDKILDDGTRWFNIVLIFSKVL